MKKTNKAFTLIELLVVVLIIGILAAIAVPKYQLAVIKSKTSTMLPTLKAIAQADSVFYMANGHYSPSIYNLDVNMPGECTTTPDGAELGQVYQCGKDFLIDNSGGYYMRTFYCPGYNDRYSNCAANSDFTITIEVNESQVLQPTCVGWTELGQKICTSFNF